MNIKKDALYRVNSSGPDYYVGRVGKVIAKRSEGHEEYVLIMQDTGKQCWFTDTELTPLTHWLEAEAM